MGHLSEEFIPWDLHGRPDIAAGAARRILETIRLRGSGGAGPVDERVMLGLARLLDAVAFSLRRGDQVFTGVISAAMETSCDVLHYLAVIPTSANPQLSTTPEIPER